MPFVSGVDITIFFSKNIENLFLKIVSVLFVCFWRNRSVAALPLRLDGHGVCNFRDRSNEWHFLISIHLYFSACQAAAWDWKWSRTLGRGSVYFRRALNLRRISVNPHNDMAIFLCQKNLNGRGPGHPGNLGRGIKACPGCQSQFSKGTLKCWMKRGYYIAAWLDLWLIETLDALSHLEVSSQQ